MSNKTWVFGADQNNADYTTNNIVDNMEVCAGVTKSKKNAGYLEIDGTMATTRLQVAVGKWLHVKVAAGSRVTFYVSSSGSAARTVNITTDAEGTDILGTLNIEKGSDNYKPYYYDYSGTTDKDIYFFVAGGGQCHVVGAKVAPMPDVAAPTFDPEGGEYTEAQSVTISCATEDVDIFYTLDGTEPTDESDLYSGAITISETATLKAIAYNADGESSEVTSATYTITAPATAANIAEFKALAANDEAELKLNNARVVYASGKDVYVRDDSGAIDFYSTDIEFEPNMVLNGSITGKLAFFRNLPELAKTDATNADKLTMTAGSEVQPTAVTVAQLLSPYYLCDLVELADVQIIEEEGKLYVTDGDDKVVIYDKYKAVGEDLVGGVKATIKAIHSVYNNDYQLLPLSYTITSGIHELTVGGLDPNAPLYNVAGQQVSADYKGIVMQKGKKFIKK